MSPWLFIFLSACLCLNCEAWTTEYAGLPTQYHRWAISGSVQHSTKPNVVFEARMTDHICKKNAGSKAEANDNDRELLNWKMGQLVGFLEQHLDEIEEVQREGDNFISRRGWMTTPPGSHGHGIAFEPTAEREAGIFRLVDGDARMMVTLKIEGKTWVITHFGPFSPATWTSYDNKKANIVEEQQANLNREVGATQLRLGQALEEANNIVHKRFLIKKETSIHTDVLTGSEVSTTNSGVIKYNAAIDEINRLPGKSHVIEKAMYRRQVAAQVQNLQFDETVWNIDDLDRAKEIIRKLEASAVEAKLDRWTEEPAYKEEIKAIQGVRDRKRRSIKAAKSLSLLFQQMR